MLIFQEKLLNLSVTDSGVSSLIKQIYKPMNQSILFFTIVGIITVMLSSCNDLDKNINTESKSRYSISLLNDEIKTSLNFDDAFSWVKTVPLTFLDETVIGEISKVIMANDHFYVLDRKIHCLYEFDLSGRSTNQYGNIGQGPGEYLRIDDFLIDSLNQQLVILSNEGQASIYFYDLRTANFIKKISTNIFPLSFCKSGENFLVYTTKNPSEQGEFDVFKIDSNGKVLDKFIPYKIDIPVIMAHSGFLKTSTKNIYYASQYDEQVYVFDEESQTFQPYMQLAINNSFIEKNKNDPFKIFQAGAVMDESTSFLVNFYETNDFYTLLTFHRKKGLGLAVHNNRNKEMIQILPESLKNDIRYRILDVFSPHGLSEQNEVIFSVDPANVMKIREGMVADTNINADIIQLIEGIDYDTQNEQHYLVTVKVKL